MLFKSLPCGAKTSWQARTLGLASSLLPLFLLVSLAQAQTGYHILDVPGSTIDIFRHMAVAGNGKIYIAANCNRPDGGFSVVAVLPDGGSLDPAWGTGGVLSRSLTAYGSEARGIAIDPNERIVVTGNATRKIKGQYDKDLAVVRYNPNGSLDMSFNPVPATKKQPATGGIVITDFGGEESGENVIFQDAKIVVGGTRNGFVNLATFRYNSNGTLDTTYGIGGMAEASFGTGYSDFFFCYSDDLTFHMGGILYGVPLSDAANGYAATIGLMRFQGNGVGLDGTFGNGGIVTYHIPENGAGMGGFAIDSNKRIVSVALTPGGLDGRCFVVRFNLDGSLDTTFGGGSGYQSIQFPGDPANWNPYAGIAFDANGKAVIGGEHFNGAESVFFVARINLDNGALDPDFGVGGVVLIPCSGLKGQGNTPQLAIVPDGKIVVGAKVFTDQKAKIFVARLLPNGTLDPSF